MKRILCLAVFFAALLSASAGTMNIYVQDWGTTNGGSSVTGNGTLVNVGWTGVAVSQTAGPYLGIYAASGANDPATGTALPVNTVYFTTLRPNQTSPGMFYTTDTSGSGSGGDSAFTDINPTLYTNLSFSVEVRETGSNDTNYFAVQVGGQWYVATSFTMPVTTTLPYPTFTNETLVYTNSANVWQSLTVNSTSVTIGGMASPNLTSPITGVGIVELPTANGFNYNMLTVTAFSPNAVPTNPPSITAPAVTPQYSFVGGGASFLITASGSQPLTYIWETNGIPIGSDPRFIGTGSNMLTITGLTLNDASVTYSVIVTNVAGAKTNGSLALNVSSVPSGVLYAEDFPYVGPNGNLPITGVGWLSSAGSGTTIGIYSAGAGIGDVFSYSSSANTNAYYTTDTNDVGLSGLPFVDINPASYPAISFQAGFVPGNAAGQVAGAISVYWAVAMNGTWYCSSQPQAIALGALSPYETYQYGFNPAATNWNSITITGTGAVIGSRAASALSGNITGAGLIIAHNDASGSDMNFQNFEIITNAALGQPPYIGGNTPNDVGVASGGGASFGVALTSGTSPFTYGWTTNGVPVQNGGRVSGANTATLTIAGLSAADNGMTVVAFVTNAAGSDESDSIYPAANLTVTNAQVGFIYSENFPFVGPVAGNYPISSVGWVEAVPSAPNALYQVTANTSQGAVFAYYGSPATTVYYATTATDTNQSGLPFPNVNLAGYSSMNFAVDIAPAYQSSNVTAYVAIQINNANWYVSASALPVPTSADSQTFATYTQAFNPAAANWKNLTVTGSGGIIGSAATSKLSGVMTGAGLVFVTVGSNGGGTFNFSNFTITGNGIGGLNAGSASGGKANITWVGNPVVKLQSNTNLNSSASWQDVPNTYGLYSLPVTTTGPQKFYRLKSP
ncbi:MAG TPA: immunoglobulin domain-containing protein [Candidatus Acidoferrales bacterium]|nr:immunoglobulin domain-containing protein [Candidatus Acidoferrales bacterium]